MRLGPLPLLDERSLIAAPHADATRERLSEQRDAIASLAALAAADALAGAGRALGRRTGGTSGTRIGVLRVLAAAAAARAAIGTAGLASVQRAIPVLGAATRAA